MPESNIITTIPQAFAFRLSAMSVIDFTPSMQARALTNPP
jgi:hypothetical protein